MFNNSHAVPSSGVTKIINTTNPQVLINVQNNLSTVLQGTYTVRAIVTATINVNGNNYSVNILSSSSSSTDVSYKLPKLISTSYNTSTCQLQSIIANNYMSTTELSVDGTAIQTLAQNVFPSRVVSTQLNVPNGGTKNVFIELATTDSSNYFTVSASSSTPSSTVVNEYTPSKSYVNL